MSQAVGIGVNLLANTSDEIKNLWRGGIGAVELGEQAQSKHLRPRPQADDREDS